MPDNNAKTPTRPSTPGTATNVNNEVTNTAGEKIEVKTTANASPNSTRPADPGTQNPSQQDEDLFELASSEPIPSTVKKRFYDENMRLVREGATYVYVPKKNLPYPWPLMEPKDQKLHKKLKAQYEDYKEAKREDLRTRTDRQRLLAALTATA